jgi:hypothetical protein
MALMTCTFEPEAQVGIPVAGSDALAGGIDGLGELKVRFV